MTTSTVSHMHKKTTTHPNKEGTSLLNPKTPKRKTRKETQQGIALGIKLSHQDLASVIGSTRETVTVVLGDLQNENLLTTGRRKITLVEMEKLAQIAEGQVPTDKEDDNLPPPIVKPPGQSCGKC